MPRYAKHEQTPPANVLVWYYEIKKCTCDEFAEILNETAKYHDTNEADEAYLQSMPLLGCATII